MKVRVLIVDDSAFARRALADALRQDPEIEVVGAAPDAYAARDMVVRLAPDVITLDVEMPRMDGISFLRRLMRHRPLPVVVVSSVTPAGGQRALEALEAGAIDVVPKPYGDYTLPSMTADLTTRVKAAHRLAVAPTDGLTVSTAPSLRPRSDGVVIAIGASTGGVHALRVVLGSLPPEAPGILVVQHISQEFTGPLASRLDETCAIHVRLARDGDEPAPGTALIAPGDKHLLLRRNGSGYRVELSDGPRVNHHRPSVDVLFKSVAQSAGPAGIGVLLTGMGADGARGLGAMKAAGATTIAQDEASCAVFGMPRAAIEAGAAELVVPLGRIADTLVETVLARPMGQPRWRGKNQA